MNTDPYLDPATGILRNRLGISDSHRLASAEAGLTLAALADLGTRTLPGGYDLSHLRSFHREIFGDIYPWAGEIRTVGIARSEPSACRSTSRHTRRRYSANWRRNASCEAFPG